MRWVAVAVMAGCYHPTPPADIACGTHGECPSGLSCTLGVCSDTDAGANRPDSGPPPIDACFASCSDPSTVLACDGTTTACDHGCVDNPPHCATLDLPLGLTGDLFTGVTATIGAPALVLDTETGMISMTGKNGMVVRPPGEGVMAGIGFSIVTSQTPSLGVFVVQDIMVGTGTWTTTGANGLVLLADTIAVAGTIDAGGSAAAGGPGGGAGASATAVATGCGGGGDGGAKSPTMFGGGGGGGAGTAGGAGGDPLAGAAGAACSTTEPLVGGSGGGTGGKGGGGAGGGGGGALALVATTSITIAGAVGTPGAGGKVAGNFSTGGGGGGGAGGAILVVAPSVTVTGALTANGGGGGAPLSTTGDGSRGSLTTATPAVGGTFANATGGSGGSLGHAATAGQSYISEFGAGGGGAAGAIHVRATTATLGGIVSPAATQSQATYH